MGNNLLWGVMPNREAAPLVVAADPARGAQDAEYIAERLRRAAYMETALLEMLGALQQFGKSNPAGFNVGVGLVPVIQQLSQLYNGELPITDQSGVAH